MSGDPFIDDPDHRVRFRGAAEITWEEYSRRGNEFPRFPEWQRAIMEMTVQIGRRDYIPCVAVLKTDKATRKTFGIHVVYIVERGADYMFFHYRDGLVIVFFISAPIEKRVADAFEVLH